MNANLLLGAPKIDRQHHELFMSFEKLASSGEAAFPDEVLSDTLSALGNQIRQHFATEEALMAGLGLPEAMLRAHCAAHSSILEEFAQLFLDATFGKSMSLHAVIATVTSWVKQHLLEHDLELKPYIAARLTQ